MSIRGLPNHPNYLISSQACGPQASGAHIRQTTHVHIITIKYVNHMHIINANLQIIILLYIANRLWWKTFMECRFKLLANSLVENFTVRRQSCIAKPVAQTISLESFATIIDHFTKATKVYHHE